ncbi:aldo/keto reductase [Aquipuribacter sp. SD81]|uniref:aldo/keto reductase n=1 Tax=Aquipuribacter sp. SD81 TaxID=3127703 RepID=UPI003018E117
MEQRAVGSSGLVVSALSVGTLHWGADTDEHEARDLLEVYLDAGGTTLDTTAGIGVGEEVLGRLLGEVVPREQVRLVAKAGVDGELASPRVDVSRGRLMAALDRTLRRLDTDHVDLWLVQAWSPHVPLEETLSALAWAQSTGRARYTGVSNYSGWQTARAATLAPDLVATSVEWSLVARGPEREVAPAAASLGLGVLAWGPLGRGVLTGKYRGGTPADSRAAAAHLSGFVAPHLTSRARRVVDGLVTAADGLGCAPQELALAWLLGRDVVASAVTGPRTAAQLRGSLGGLDVVVPDEIVAVLDEVSAG